MLRLAQEREQKSAEKQIERATAVGIGLDCSTFTRAREIPIPGHPNPPSQLRSTTWPEGLQFLIGKDARRVQEANEMTDFLACMLAALHAEGQGVS